MRFTEADFLVLLPLPQFLQLDCFIFSPPAFILCGGKDLMRRKKRKKREMQGTTFAKKIGNGGEKPRQRAFLRIKPFYIRKMDDERRERRGAAIGARKKGMGNSDTPREMAQRYFSHYAEEKKKSLSRNKNLSCAHNKNMRKIRRKQECNQTDRMIRANKDEADSMLSLWGMKDRKHLESKGLKNKKRT